MTKTYKDRKNQAREEAIEWQTQFADMTFNISWGEYAEQVARFEKLAKRYGLIKEFKENGII